MDATPSQWQWVEEEGLGTRVLLEGKRSRRDCGGGWRAKAVIGMCTAPTECTVDASVGRIEGGEGNDRSAAGGSADVRDGGEWAAGAGGGGRDLDRGRRAGARVRPAWGVDGGAVAAGQRERSKREPSVPDRRRGPLPVGRSAGVCRTGRRAGEAARVPCGVGGEVEAVLREHPWVREAAVVVLGRGARWVRSAGRRRGRGPGEAPSGERAGDSGAEPEGSRGVVPGDL